MNSNEFPTHIFVRCAFSFCFQTLSRLAWIPPWHHSLRPKVVRRKKARALNASWPAGLGQCFRTHGKASGGGRIAAAGSGLNPKKGKRFARLMSEKRDGASPFALPLNRPEYGMLRPIASDFVDRFQFLSRNLR